MKLIDLTGKTFGQWRVVSRNSENYRSSFARWDCVCSCGTHRPVLANSLLTGKSTNCGCVRRKNMSQRQTVHGCSTRNNETKTYRIWKHMIQRCNNTANKDYKYYGGRGISVCKEWLSFERFLADMGECPDNLTIDRFPNNDGNYEPSNCRWATMAQQNLNKRTSRFSPCTAKTS